MTPPSPSQPWRALRRFVAGARRVRREDGVGVVRQVLEFVVMSRAIGATPIEFFRYRLWDVSVPRATRLRFITWRLRQPLEPFLNSRSDSIPLTSKLHLDGFFQRHGLPTPQRLGVWCPEGAATDATDAIRTAVDFAAVTSRSPGGVVLKREFGMSGEAVLVFTGATENGLQHASGEHWSFDRVILRMSGKDPWLIQTRINAHPALTAISGRDHAATLRIVTCLRKDGNVLLLPATLKLATTGEGVDNFSAGNLGIAVSPEGVLGTGAAGLDGPALEAHPATGIRFVGVAVPHWDDACELARRAQSHCPTVRSLGWDVAITPHGALMIEANPYWAVDIIQQPGLRGLVHGEFREFVEEIGAGRALRVAERR